MRAKATSWIINATRITSSAWSAIAANIDTIAITKTGFAKDLNPAIGKPTTGRTTDEAVAGVGAIKTAMMTAIIVVMTDRTTDIDPNMDRQVSRQPTAG